MPPSRGAAPAGSPFILSARADAILVFGAPLLLLLALAPLSVWIGPEAIAFFILGALALGHHLPGFLRVYGDPEFFARHRYRLLGAPIVFFALTFTLAWRSLEAAVLILLLWGVWHVMMQVFGFARIYGAKRGETGVWTGRLDWILCATVFFTGFLWSGPMAARFRTITARLGVEGLGWLFQDPARQVMLVLALVVGVGYGVHVVWRWQRGRPVAPLKLAFLVTSLGFVAVGWVFAGGVPLLGLAFFELFHDVQYVAIVWAANRSLVARGGGGVLLGAVFRPRRRSLLLYGAMVLAYGCLVYVRAHAPGHFLRVLLVALIQTSTLLHYYTDGFAWKVRRPRTRRDLDISRSLVAQRTRTSLRTAVVPPETSSA